MKSGVRSAAIWTLLLSIVLAPLLIVGPFIAGYAGGRKAKETAGALIATLGPALIWMALWWWLSRAEITIGRDKFTPPVGVLAPTTALAILGGAFAGSGKRVEHVVGMMLAIFAFAWVWPSAREIYSLVKLAQPAPAAGPVTATTTNCPEHLKKIYDATMIYADSWDGQLPPASIWATALRNPDQTLVEEENLHCPDAAGTKYGYAMNSALGGKRVKEIKDPAKAPLFFDSENLTLNANSPTAAAVTRHGGKCNIVFADGHLGQQ